MILVFSNLAEILHRTKSDVLKCFALSISRYHDDTIHDHTQKLKRLACFPLSCQYLIVNDIHQWGAVKVFIRLTLTH